MAWRRQKCPTPSGGRRRHGIPQRPPVVGTGGRTEPALEPPTPDPPTSHSTLPLQPPPVTCRFTRRQPRSNTCSRCRGRRHGQGRAGAAGDDQRARPRPGRGRGAGAGVRRLPHRPALPGGRNQRRLPVPARARGGRGRGVGGRGRHRRRAGRLRRPQLARRLRQLSGLHARRALVLLRHPQRHPEDDPGGRHRVSPALGIGAFAEKTLVASGQCTKVDPEARRRRSGCSAAASWPGSVPRSTPAT